MPELVIMSHNGDDRILMGAVDGAKTEKAMARFKELMGQGYIATKKDAAGNKELTRTFDPSADIIMHPQLIGG